MAYFYGINVGQDLNAATVNTSTQTKDVEVNVNATNITNKEDLLVAMEKLTIRIAKSGYPPASE